jgi:hypothetical protein
MMEIILKCVSVHISVCVCVWAEGDAMKKTETKGENLQDREQNIWEW